MAIAPVQTVTGSGLLVASFLLGTWTPAATDVVLLAVHTRGTAVTHTSVSGNSLTWTKIAELNAASGQIRSSLWRAQGASPTAGQITVTLSAATSPTVIGVATRFSGVNLATPVEASITNSSSVANTTPTVNLTTLTNAAMGFASITHRGATFTIGSGETAILLNTSAGSGGDVLKVSTEYQITPTTGLVTLDGTLSAANDWIAIAASLVQAGTSPSKVPGVPYVITPPLNFALEV